MSMLIVCLLLALINGVSPLSGQIGFCSLDDPPASWLVTSGAGIMDWATSGVRNNNGYFCLEGNKSAETMKVAYHIDLPPQQPKLVEKVDVKKAMLDNPNNACVVNDTQIQYCLPFCSEDWQVKVIASALSSSQPQNVANAISQAIYKPFWAISVLQVDFNNPAAHLNASIFLDQSVWCSVYIGIKPNLGFPYLYEIQLGKVLQN